MADRNRSNRHARLTQYPTERVTTLSGIGSSTAPVIRGTAWRLQLHRSTRSVHTGPDHERRVALPQRTSRRLPSAQPLVRWGRVGARHGGGSDRTRPPVHRAHRPLPTANDCHCTGRLVDKREPSTSTRWRYFGPRRDQNIRQNQLSTPSVSIHAVRVLGSQSHNCRVDRSQTADQQSSRLMRSRLMVAVVTPCSSAYCSIDPQSKRTISNMFSIAFGGDSKKAAG